jgi:prepilin-type N-terminal cleavage/methylation domain-containing protein
MSAGLKRARLGVRSGYSLLEVIVVVAILGIAATASGPSIARMIATQQAQQVVRGVATEMGALRAEAFLNSTPLRSQDIQTRLDAHIPSDWRIVVDDTLHIAASGYCSAGGVVIFSSAGRRWAFEVASGDCEVRPATS